MASPLEALREHLDKGYQLATIRRAVVLRREHTSKGKPVVDIIPVATITEFGGCLDAKERDAAATWLVRKIKEDLEV